MKIDVPHAINKESLTDQSWVDSYHQWIGSGENKELNSYDFFKHQLSRYPDEDVAYTELTKELDKYYDDSTRHPTPEKMPLKNNIFQFLTSIGIRLDTDRSLTKITANKIGNPYIGVAGWQRRINACFEELNVGTDKYSLKQELGKYNTKYNTKIGMTRLKNILLLVGKTYKQDNLINVWDNPNFPDETENIGKYLIDIATRQMGVQEELLHDFINQVFLAHVQPEESNSDG